MNVNKRTNWILSSVGLFSVALSVIVLFATPVYASCSASVPCGGSTMSCSCAGSGSCESEGQCVTCVCSGQPKAPKDCCIDENG